MLRKHDTSTGQAGPSTSAASWDLRHPGLIMKDGEREVHEFTGMWPLKPDADLVTFTKRWPSVSSGTRLS